LAYWREDGEIIFCGRKDHQIKLNGQRIELGEIEKVISDINGVESVAVMIKQNNGKDVIVAYCCGDAQKSILKEHCENRLPRYMVPSAFVIVDKMPLNASGKLDRKQLSAMDVVFEEFVKEKPVNETEEMVCRAFEKILHTENVGRNESFFDLGGTSIDMISILSENEFKDITAAQFIANPTPEKLAEFMTGNKKSVYENFDVLRDVPNSRKALILVPYAGGDATAFAKLVDSIVKRNNDMSIYYVDYLRSYEECEKVADIIAEMGKTNELYIYSHCAGASVALQLINILEDNGVSLSHYVSGGYIPPKKPPKKNGWNMVSDAKIMKKLSSAGAPLDNFSDEQSRNMIDNFRKDTDFMTWYHYNNAKEIKVSTDVIISKTDLFTKNYMEAEKLWKKTADSFNNVYFIETDSHYFQADNSDTLADIIIKVIEK
jgi:surfactin synthase thioesterase subunit